MHDVVAHTVEVADASEDQGVPSIELPNAMRISSSSSSSERATLFATLSWRAGVVRAEMTGQSDLDWCEEKLEGRRARLPDQAEAAAQDRAVSEVFELPFSCDCRIERVEVRSQTGFASQSLSPPTSSPARQGACAPSQTIPRPAWRGRPVCRNRTNTSSMPATEVRPRRASARPFRAPSPSIPEDHSTRISHVRIASLARPSTDGCGAERSRVTRRSVVGGLRRPRPARQALDRP